MRARIAVIRAQRARERIRARVRATANAGIRWRARVDNADFGVGVDFGAGACNAIATEHRNRNEKRPVHDPQIYGASGSQENSPPTQAKPRETLSLTAKCAVNTRSFARDPEPLHPAPNLGAIFAELARYRREVAVVAADRRDELVAQLALFGRQRCGVDARDLVGRRAQRAGQVI